MASKPSILQQLLVEISYDGATVSRYKRGGLGMENVLTAEVLQGLDFLPREHFLGGIVQAMNGQKIEVTRTQLLTQIEQASLTFLPGPIRFRPETPQGHQATVNPDGIIETAGVYVFVEAKRLRSSSFQREQLAREFVVVTREADRLGRRPLLLLVLGHAPPVRIARAGQQAIDHAIRSTLEPVLRKVTSPNTAVELAARIDESVAWITWQTIADIVRAQLSIFRANPAASASIYSAVERVANSVISAIMDHA